MDVISNNPNMSDYFWPRINREADKEGSRLITQKFTINFVIFFRN